MSPKPPTPELTARSGCNYDGSDEGSPRGARRARALSSPREVTEGIIKVKNLPMKLAGMLQGAASRSSSGDSAEGYRRAHQGRCAGGLKPGRPFLNTL